MKNNLSPHRTARLYVASLVTSILLILCSSASLAAISIGERAALLAIYDSTNGGNWNNSTNWYGAAGTECIWYGVACDVGQTTVTAINLGSNNLSGTLVSNLSDLTNLSDFRVNNNSLTGTVPALTGLTSLQYFVVHNNLLTALPDFTGLTSLRYIYAHDNQLTTIPALTGLVNLLELQLARNQLTTLPALTGLGSLTHFMVHINQLTVLPDFTGLTSLRYIYAHDNQLTTIPALTGLVNLLELQVARNQLTTVPALTGLTSLTHFMVHINQLTALPDFTGLTDLRYIYAHDNQLTTIPALTGLVNLLELQLGNNYLTTLPALTGLMSLTHFMVHINQLTALPDFAGLTSLRYIYAHDNQLTTIPALTGLVNLLELQLGSNQLTTLPALTGLTSLTHFMVHGNQLTTLPALTDLVSLKYLYAYNNQLATIPALTGLVNLIELQLGENNLTTLPALTGLTSLQSLIVQNNQLTTLPDLTGLTSLRHVYAYNNELAALPALTGLVNLSEIRVQNNKLAGALPALTGLVSLQYFIVHDNQLTALPDFTGLTNLSHVYAYNNELAALPALTGLVNLSEIRVQNNKLAGALPALTGLVSLQYFIVHDNQLTALPDFTGLTSLRYIYAYNNQLTTIAALTGLANLIELQLGENDLTTLPALSGLTSLQSLIVQNNQLTALPDLTGLTSLRHIYAYNNQLTALPALTGLVSVSEIRVQNNNLTGALPALTGLTNLQYFIVNNNQFAGDVPAIPFPSALLAGGSSLCPNLLNHTSDPAWDAATGQTPWFANCTSASVSYNGNTNTGGSVPADSTIYASGATVTVMGPGSLVKTGFNFASWNTSAGGGGTTYAPASTFVMGPGNVTLYAQWAPVVTLTVPGTPTPLPNYSSVGYSWAWRINNSGKIVGYAYDTTRILPIIWSTPTSVPTELPGFPPYQPTARGVNHTGQIVGEFSQGAGGALYWANASTTPVQLPNGPFAGPQAFGINGALEIVGVGHNGTSYVPILWASPASVPVALEVSPLCAPGECHAEDINDAGEIVGYAYNSSTRIYTTLRWNRGTLALIAPLNGGGFLNPAVYGNSNTGQAVGTSYPPNGANGGEGLFWASPGAVPIQLAHPGKIYAGATGINDVGQLVGNVSDGTAASIVPSIWTLTLPATLGVTYNGNGNTGGSSPVDGSLYASGATVTVMGPGSLVKTGFTFAGWNTSAGGAGTPYAPASTFVMGPGNVTLYAQWSPTPTYFVTYVGNSNTGGSSPIDGNAYLAGVSVTVLGSGSLVRTGYDFAGWNTGAGGSGTSYTPGVTFVIGSGNVTLYAQWTPIAAYAVTYNGNTSTGGSAPIDGNIYASGATVTVLGSGSLVKSGYDFAGWNTAAGGGGTQYAPAATFAIGSGNVTLYAQWIPIGIGSPITFNTTHTFATGTNPFSVAVADVNGDGRLDVVTANAAGGNVSVLRGNGDGTFQVAQDFPAGSIGGSFYGLAIADFNGDGNLDLVVTDFVNNSVNVLLGNGDGTFQPPISFAAESQPDFVVTGDFNGDGKVDLVVGYDTGTVISVLLGNGNGTFQPRVDHVVGASARGLTVARLDGNATDDIGAANIGGAVNVYLGDGNGSFATPGEYLTATGAFRVSSGDFNGDGKLDLVAVNLSYGVSVFLGIGDGTFQPRIDLSLGTNPFDVEAGDFNGDGRVDLVVTHANGSVSTLEVKTGNGDGTFQPGVAWGTGWDPTRVAVADLNGDGKLDMVTSNLSSHSVTVLLNTTPVTPVITSLATSHSHSCALYSTGHVKCWGGNDRGQLGDGTTTTRLSPVDVVGPGGVGTLSGVIAISSATASTCALLATRLVVCWGENTYGQLGDGTTTDRHTPDYVRFAGAGTLGNVAAIRSGYHACALLATGHVYCWGLNDIGQVGDGTTNERHAPVPVVGTGGIGVLHGVDAIDLKALHTCALLSGTVKCWGRNAEYQLIGSSDSAYVPNPIPLDVPGLTGVAQIAASHYRTCALMAATHGVKCWGDGGPVSDVAGLTSGVERLTSNYRHECVLLATGQVMCRGMSTDSNDNGELGDNTTNSRVTSAFVHGKGNVGLLSDVLLLSAGTYHNCVVLADGRIECWGMNGGRLGDCTGTTRLTPVDVRFDCSNGPPMANAGPNQTLEATGPVGASVSLDGSGSSDPDANPLTFQWSGPFGPGGSPDVVAGPTPMVTVPIGTFPVTLTVSDGLTADSATVVIKVQDTTPPNATSVVSATDGNGSTVLAGGSTSSSTIVLIFGANDAVGIAGYECKLDSVPAFGPCPTPPTYSTVSLGTHIVRVRARDAAGNLDAVPGGFTWTVKKATITTIAPIALEPSLVGQAYAVKVTVKGPVPQDNPDGAVTISDGNGGSCTDTLNKGAAQCKLTSTVGGLLTITATYGGSAAFVTSTGTLLHTVTPLKLTSTTIAPIAIEPSLAGQAYTVVVKVDSAVPQDVPDGKITLSDGQGATCTDNLNMGAGQCKLTSTVTGQLTITAIYSGSSIFATSTGTLPHTVAPLKTTSTTIAPIVPEPSLAGQVYAVNVTVQGVAPQDVPAGNVTVSDGQTSCSINLKAGTGQCKLTPKTAGQYTITAVYGGSAVFAGSTGTQAHAVVQLVKATTIAAGDHHVCAIVDDGTVRCWGYNGYGQLGSNSPNVNPVPLLVPGVAGVKAIATGAAHTCAIVSGGGVMCWGNNSIGQLGDGTAGNSKSTPVPVSTLASGVTDIAAGGDHTCAIKGGAVFCWGGNTAGPSQSTPTPVPAGLGNGVSAITAGISHTCAIVKGGVVRCWGNNDYGQLGDNTVNASATPVTVQGTSGVAAIAAGGAHTCAIKGGSLMCWGYNNEGQLGDGTGGNSKPTPVPVLTLGSGVKAVAAGRNHTCSVSGSTKCWGTNNHSQLGNDPITTPQSFTPLGVATLAAGGKVVAAGIWHSCVLMTSFGVKCWGSNDFGQLGNNTINGSYTPVNVIGFVN